MKAKRQMSIAHMGKFSGAIFLIVFFIFSFASAVLADSYQALMSFTVANIPPSIDSTIYVNNGDSEETFFPDVYNASSDPISLSAGTDTAIHVMGSVGDLNGVGTDLTETGNGDIDKIIVFAYEETDGDFGSCVDDIIAGNADGYVCNGGGFSRDESGDMDFNTCTFDYVSPTELNFDCVIPFSFRSKSTPNYLDPEGSKWHVGAIVRDLTAEVNFSSEVLVGVGETLGLTFPSSLAYGVVNPGMSLEEPIEYEVTQAGNVAAGVRVSGGALTCAVGELVIGSIPLENQRWALSGATDYASAEALTSDIESSEALTGLTVAVPTSTNTTALLYWNLLMPATDVGGNCTGTTTMLAIPSV